MSNSPTANGRVLVDPSCDHPVVLRLATSPGPGKPIDQLIDEAAERLAFLEGTPGSPG